MANDKPESGTDNPGESLSATGMFLRAFGEPAKAEPPAPDPLFGSPVEQPPQPAAPKQAPGEFTQLFQSLEAKPIAPSAASAPPASATASAEPQARLGTAVKTPPQTGADQAGGPGEFTRLFVGGTSPTPPVARRSTEDSLKPVAPPAQSSSRGFSAPGVSGSASGEGSFTQIFSTPPAKSSSPLGEPQPANPPGNAGWNNDPIFRSPQNPPPAEPPSPSVTTLLASLGTPGGSPAGRAPEPAPYRPEPNPRPAPLISHEPPEVGSGGVTRLIQRLAQTPVEPAPPPTPAVAPPVNAGPGEFTRIISRQNAATAEPAAAAAPPAPPAPAGFGFPAAPPTPAFAPPPAPQFAPPAAAPAPKFAPPPAPVVPMPAAPKPPAVVAPAVAPPKTKLEAMVPILLVINTFLLLILLVVVIFLVKSR